jgi:15-cis-phytoene synthase
MPDSVVSDETRSLARGYAPDFYLSALLAPRVVRVDLLALSAFYGDVARIIATVSEPALADIRLQWWRDSIANSARGEKSGHPIADALGDAIRSHNLPVALFHDFLDARSFDLYADPVPDEDFHLNYLDKADGSAFKLSALCVGDKSADRSTLVTAAGRAYGHTRLIRHLPAFLARGRVPFPGLPAGDAAALLAALPGLRDKAQQSLAVARSAWRKAPREHQMACLPIAVVGAYLTCSARRGFNPVREVSDVEPLSRIGRLWWAHLRNRI